MPGETVKANIDYIEVPLLVQFSIPTSGSIMPFLMGGGYLAFNLSAKVKGDGWDMDIKEDTKSLDYGIMVGAGALINNMIEICARYSMGLITGAEEEAGIQPDMKNSVIQILAGIHL